jgi:glycosyltransferase involved in cell wall biosynthesis
MGSVVEALANSARPLSASNKGLNTMRVALVHEWLTTYAGSEKVLEVMLSEFPNADLYTLIDRLPEQHRAGFSGRKINTTFLQKVPFVQHFYRWLLPFMPMAIEQLDMSGYDVVISNSHAVAKGIITGPDQLHICYCYTPMRYAWDLQAQYLKESNMERGVRSILSRYLLHKIRMWDYRSAQSVDHFIACSNYIGRRIKKAYNRDSVTIYPNVDTEKFVPGQAKEDFYLTSSRMVPYKKIHLIVEAFSKMPDRKLVVIGTGPQFKRIKALAGPNVTIMGYQPFSVLLDHMQRARAFIFAAEEDFGITPIEPRPAARPSSPTAVAVPSRQWRTASAACCSTSRAPKPSRRRLFSSRRPKASSIPSGSARMPCASPPNASVRNSPASCAPAGRPTRASSTAVV